MSLTETADCRAAGAGFAPTRKSSVPLPCPFVDEPRLIHDAVVEADHVQSRVVSIATVPAPPAAGTFDMELVADSWHFDVVGATSCVDDDDLQPAIASQAITAEVSGKVRASRTISRRDYARGRPSKRSELRVGSVVKD